MSLFTGTTARATEALERIASALEHLVALQGGGHTTAPPEHDESAVLYHDDASAVWDEYKREMYYQRTGKRVPEGEKVPEPPAKEADQRSLNWDG